MKLGLSHNIRFSSDAVFTFKLSAGGRCRFIPQCIRFWTENIRQLFLNNLFSADISAVIKFIRFFVIDRSQTAIEYRSPCFMQAEIHIRSLSVVLISFLQERSSFLLSFQKGNAEYIMITKKKTGL